MLNPYVQILRLARSGSPERAWSLMAKHRLLDSDDDPKALSLQARLVKDRAKRAVQREERARLFDQSAQLYLKAGQLSGESYPLINAASLAKPSLPWVSGSTATRTKSTSSSTGRPLEFNAS